MCDTLLKVSHVDNDTVSVKAERMPTKPCHRCRIERKKKIKWGKIQFDLCLEHSSGNIFNLLKRQGFFDELNIRREHFTRQSTDSVLTQF